MSRPDRLTVPSGAFTFCMKTKAIGADRYEASEAMRGHAEEYGTNYRLAYAIFCRYLTANLITEWDRVYVPEDMQPGEGARSLPITAQTVAEIDDLRDYEFLIASAIERVQLRDESAQEDFSQPSTPTTTDTSSIPKTSQGSSGKSKRSTR